PIAARRASIRRQLGLLRKVQAQSQLRQKATEALAELVSDDPPPTLVEHETRHRLQDMAMRLSAQGIDPQAWLEAQAQNPGEGVVPEMREAAATAVKVNRGFPAVARAGPTGGTGE